VRMSGTAVCDARVWKQSNTVNLTAEKSGEGGLEAAIDAPIDLACLGLPPPFAIACAAIFDTLIDLSVELVEERVGSLDICD
jgi:hypothetical protein